MVPLCCGTSFCYCSTPHTLLFSLECPFLQKPGHFHSRAQLPWSDMRGISGPVRLLGPIDSKEIRVTSIFVALRYSFPAWECGSGHLPSDRTSPSISKAFSHPQDKRLTVFFCSFLFTFLSCFIYYCCGGGGVHTILVMWRSEDNVQESVSFRLCES